jgi:hypothetical protein
MPPQVAHMRLEMAVSRAMGDGRWAMDLLKWVVSVSWRQMRRMRLPSASHHLPIALQLAVLYSRHTRRRRYLGVRRCTKSREMGIGRMREA